MSPILIFILAYLAAAILIVANVLIYKKIDGDKHVWKYPVQVVLLFITCICLFAPLNTVIQPKEEIEVVDTIELVNQVKKNLGYETID